MDESAGRYLGWAAATAIDLRVPRVHKLWSPGADDRTGTLWLLDPGSDSRAAVTLTPIRRTKPGRAGRGNSGMRPRPPTGGGSTRASHRWARGDHGHPGRPADRTATGRRSHIAKQPAVVVLASDWPLTEVAGDSAALRLGMSGLPGGCLNPECFSPLRKTDGCVNADRLRHLGNSARVLASCD